jgi:replicative superfamily II helicase
MSPQIQLKDYLDIVKGISHIDAEPYTFRELIKDHMQNILDKQESCKWAKIMLLLISENKEEKISYRYLIEKLEQLKRLLKRDKEINLLYGDYKSLYREWLKDLCSL